MKSTNIGFCGLLFIVLLIMKATEIVTWSWWIIFLPLYLPFAILFFVVVGGAALALIFAAWLYVSDKLKRK